jgi:hypothetical protein
MFETIHLRGEVEGKEWEEPMGASGEDREEGKRDGT